MPDDIENIGDRIAPLGALTEATINKLRLENYRSHAASMRAMAARTSHERMRSEYLELAVGWDLLAKRLEDLTTKIG